MHSAPTYVHCKAGKSRSVTVVLAYLIHANAWTLKTAYAYVAERRTGISPNIGFVAELMQFEETELGIKQSGGVQGEDDKHKKIKDEKAQKGNSRMRDSMPSTWVANSLDQGRLKALPPGIEGKEQDHEEERAMHQMGDEREVRKNGYWVQQRR